MKGLKGILVFWVPIALLYACASILKLQVTYILPDEKTNFQGPVSLQVIDRRPVKELFTEAVRKSTGPFSKDIQLGLASPGSKHGFLLGLFEVPEMFENAFVERLKAAGVSVGPSSEVRLVIEVQEFTIDVLRASLVEKRWNTRIAYQGTLFRGNEPVYSQSVKADSEKLRYWRDLGLDALVSETFSEAVNTFDLKEALARQR
jgi:hypothetical protein